MRARLTVALAALVVVGAATAAADSGPLRVSFSGRYAVTYKVTNVKSLKPTRWLFSPSTTCKSPCRAVSFRQRLAAEKRWRAFILTYTWNGDGYALARRVQRGLADCRGAADQTVHKGFDVTSTSTIRPAKTLNGRVVRFTGTAEDAYVPNAAGRKAGCAP